MKKRMLKGWVVKVLGSIIGSWIFFCAVTIENIGNKTYDIVLTIWSILAIGSLLLLASYSNILEE